MKSSKQRRAEIQAKREALVAEREAQAKAIASEQRRKQLQREFEAGNGVPVNRELLAPYRSYFDPEFVERGFYVDIPFECVDCGKAEVWTASQQKWWYEVAKGYAYSTARRCRACRRVKRDPQQASQAVHPEGLTNKSGP